MASQVPCALCRSPEFVRYKPVIRERGAELRDEPSIVCTCWHCYYTWNIGDRRVGQPDLRGEDQQEERRTKSARPVYYYWDS